MTMENFYQDYYPMLLDAKERLTKLLAAYADDPARKTGIASVQNHSARIKTPESMKRKLEKRGLPVTAEAAVHSVTDAVGVRAVCSYPAGVYLLADWLRERPEITDLETKDYIAEPKENGYRSLHLIVRLEEGAAAGLAAEIQLRTLALDFWASLEHQIKYKKEIAHEELIRRELKRCADEIASVDLTMQTIQELILEDSQNENFGQR